MSTVKFQDFQGPVRSTNLACKLWSWPTLMQMFKVNGHSVATDKQMDGGDYITCRINVIHKLLTVVRVSHRLQIQIEHEQQLTLKML